MEGLPLLPGNTFRDVTQTRFHRSQLFNFQRGYRVPRITPSAAGGRPLDVQSVAHLKDLKGDDSLCCDPALIYGRIKQPKVEVFYPKFVLFNNKVLRFYCYFKEEVNESPLEHYRVRPCHLLYYLEDDTLEVVEPRIENSQLVQGALIRRHKVPKNSYGESWTWKDINVGNEITLYGRVFRITDTDPFSREYLTSQGVIVNPPENVPPDPYTQNRMLCENIHTATTPSDWDKLKKFLHYDKKVLRFYAIWDDRDNRPSRLGKYTIHYYLADDTVEVTEDKSTAAGEEVFPLLLSRTRLPKNWKDIPVDFPSAVMERTDKEVEYFYLPEDFMIGNTVFIFGRRLLIYDMDEYTRNYFRENYKVEEFPTVTIPDKGRPQDKPEIPPHYGFGSLEDSLQSVLHLRPKRPKQDVVKMLINTGKVLRYTAAIDWVHPEDEGRKFVINYRIGDDTMSIYEPACTNSGLQGGKILDFIRVPKPGTDIACNPEFYSPVDFKIGEKIEVFGIQYIITGTDMFTYRYMAANPHKFPSDVIQSVQDFFAKQGIYSPEDEPRKERQEESKQNEQTGPPCKNVISKC